MNINPLEVTPHSASLFTQTHVRQMIKHPYFESPAFASRSPTIRIVSIPIKYKSSSITFSDNLHAIYPQNQILNALVDDNHCLFPQNMHSFFCNVINDDYCAIGDICHRDCCQFILQNSDFRTLDTIKRLDCIFDSS